MADYNPNDPYGIGSYYGGDFSANTPAQAAKAVADQNAVNNYYNTAGLGPAAAPAAPAQGPGGAGLSAEDAYWADKAARESTAANAAEARRVKAASDKLEGERTSARGYLNTLLSEYNMQSLAGSVWGLVQQSTNNDWLMEQVRLTSDYKARFKGLLTLRGRGNTDIRNEAEYLDLETDYRSAFNEAGLRDYLGTDGSQSEYDSIAELVGDYSVSVEEVKARIGDAQRIVADTPQEVRDSLQKFYNIDPTLLVEYTLDPTRSQNKINSVANAAVVGGYGTRAGLDLDVTGAELVGNLAGDADIRLESLNRNLVQGATLRDATKRLANIDKMELSDSEALTASMDADATAKKKVTGLQSRERARFGGAGAFGPDALKSLKKI